MKQLASRDNPTFKALRALSEDAREVRRQSRTLLDGLHLVGLCIERGMSLQQLIVSDMAMTNPAVSRLLAQAATAEVLQVSDALFSQLSGIKSPVGIAAVIELPPDAGEEITGDAVVLNAVQDAGNVGTILRTAAAAGVRDVVLGQGCAGAWTPRVLRAGQGAHFSLRLREGLDLPDWLAQRPQLAAISLAMVARDGADLYATDLRGPGLWLLGNEGAGLAPALLAHAARRVTIPMAAATESLNVAAAAAVGLFEAVRQRRPTSADFS